MTMDVFVAVLVVGSVVFDVVVAGGPGSAAAHANISGFAGLWRTKLRMRARRASRVPVVSSPSSVSYRMMVSFLWV